MGVLSLGGWGSVRRSYWNMIEDDVAYIDPSNVPRLPPVGPWGWAARMQRLDLIVSTAALLGHQSRHIQLIPDGYYGPCEDAPWWYSAYAFLLIRGLCVTESLTIVQTGQSSR